jgi:hypothetical protein
VSLLLDDRYATVVTRLAAGIEPRDALRLSRVAAPLELLVEKPAGLPDVELLRHPSSRWALRYVPRLPATVDVLIRDPRRCYVARRLRLPIPAEAAVIAAEDAGSHVPASERTWRPALFPGAAYPVSPFATGLRGLARRAGKAARWVRVEAIAPATNTVIARAHGDDRGEFLLLLPPLASAPADLPDTIQVTIEVRGPKPAPAAPAGPLDPHWDVPRELLAAPGPDDPVSRGVQPPAGYQPGASASATLDLVPGRIATLIPPFDLV